MTRTNKLLIAAYLAGILGILRLNANMPVSPEIQTSASAPAGSPHSLKDIVPVESPGDSLIAPRKGFEVVPGKDPSGWSFILEPYLWAMGMDGTVGVKGFDSHVNFSPLTVVKHLDWGIMAKGEIRKGRWGILGDGFFAQLSADGDPPGPLYDNVSLKIQQGMAQLALAYRIIDDRRGFLDIYAGARYNYLGISIDAGLDSSNFNQIATDATDRIAGAVSARVENAVAAEEQKLRVELADERAILGADARNRIAASLNSDLSARLNADFGKRLKRDLLTGARGTELLSNQDLRRVSKGVLSQYRSFLNAVLDARLAQGEARLDAAKAQAKAQADARVAAAEKRLTKAITKKLGNALPTSESGSEWWVDPIIGLRGQINLTRWLFLAIQGDVGGFGAGSQIAWQASGTVGINLTRNIFVETGYRYFYMDYKNGGFLYKAAEAGIFSGIGVKF
jgi:hypothetical protein